ncbi:hypothetical protein [Bartonella sp. HY406]|uniref:hypothetical protein n=1 Tax=Bartonella sp. HY406 TaxID=2979331 RepID=UPI0021C84274|nr:hypothetical protein [Bartonella sp. HY406]UXN04939.1 hypothetical protein N6B01_14640 [Bartonella sp. HY406]
MKHFFKSFLLTIIIHNILLGFFIWLFVFNYLGDDTASDMMAGSLLTPLLIVLGIFTVMDLLLMLFIALPFFAIVRRNTKFAWYYGILMGLVMGGATGLFLRLTSKSYNSAQFVGSLLLWFIFGLIFAAVYSWSTRREKRPLAKVDQVFK